MHKTKVEIIRLDDSNLYYLESRDKLIVKEYLQRTIETFKICFWRRKKEIVVNEEPIWKIYKNHIKLSKLLDGILNDQDENKMVFDIPDFNQEERNYLSQVQRKTKEFADQILIYEENVEIFLEKIMMEREGRWIDQFIDSIKDYQESTYFIAVKHNLILVERI